MTRKPAFCICENKDADQLRCNREADQRLCFHYTDSSIPLLPKSEISARFVLDLVGNPEKRVFSQRGSIYVSSPYSLYPRHLCRRVYSFHLSIICPFVCSFVSSFVLPSRLWNLRQSFALKFLKWCISQQLLIRKHSYLDHSYPGGLAFTP